MVAQGARSFPREVRNAPKGQVTAPIWTGIIPHWVSLAPPMGQEMPFNRLNLLGIWLSESESLRI